MLTYTITEGASYITDEILLLQTTVSSTKNADVFLIDCNSKISTVRATEETYSTFYQFTNGNYTREYAILYSDNGPTRQPKLTCGEDTNTYTIGNTPRCPRQIQYSKTVYSSDGQATIIVKRITQQGNGECEDDFRTYIYDQPIFGDSSTAVTTTTKLEEATQTTKTFIRKHHSVITYDTKNSDFVFSYYYSEYFTYTAITDELKNKEITVLTTETYDNKIITRYSRILNSDDYIGYPETSFSDFPKNYNYVNTVVYFADNTEQNIELWYRTVSKFDENNIDKLITKSDVYAYTKYKGTKEKNSAVTISFIEPSFYSAIIGKYNADKSDTKYPSSLTESGLRSGSQEYSSLFYNEEDPLNIYKTTWGNSVNISVMPLGTVKSAMEYWTTKRSKFTVFSYTTYSGFPEEMTQIITYTLTYPFRVNNFIWHNFKERTAIIQGSSSPYDYKYSICGNCEKTAEIIEKNSEGNEITYTHTTSYTDYAEYSYIKNFYLYMPDNDKARTFSVNAGFVDGMVSPDKLTSFAKEVSLNLDNSFISTFNTLKIEKDAFRQVIIGAMNYIGGYHWYSAKGIFIYPNMPVCVPNLSTTFPGPQIFSNGTSYYFSSYNLTKITEQIITKISTIRQILNSTTTTFISEIFTHPVYRGKSTNNKTYIQMEDYKNQEKYTFDPNHFYQQFITPISPPEWPQIDSFFTLPEIQGRLFRYETYQIDDSIFYLNKNIGKYRNDNKIEGDGANITIFCTPGSYIKIGSEITETFEIEDSISFFVQDDKKRYIYLPSVSDIFLKTRLDINSSILYDYFVNKTSINFTNFINCLGNYNIFIERQNPSYFRENYEFQSTQVFGLIPLSDRSEYRRV